MKPIRDPRQLALSCLFMRGGSSRGAYFLADDLPSDPERRAAVLLAAYGSPDLRQIDGIGGADPLTSKAAIVSRSSRSDADLDYTFCQVGIDQPKVSTGGNCGNMLAAVGPFGLLRGLVEPVEPVTEIRIFTTNTGQVVTACVPVCDGVPDVDGDCIIAGVPGSGGRIDLDFGDCAGAMSGELLPTGNAQDRIEVDSRTVSVSLVDAATPFVFVDAADVEASGTETPEQITANASLMARLEAIRGWAATVLSLVDDPVRARQVTPNVPRVMMVAAPAAYATASGGSVGADECDLIVRQLAMQRPHRALAVTGAACAAVAASVSGTVPAALRREGKGEEMRLGHPSGVLRVGARVTVGADGGTGIESVRIERSARMIMEGTLYARLSTVEGLLGRIEA